MSKLVKLFWCVLILLASTTITLDIMDSKKEKPLIAYTVVGKTQEYSSESTSYILILRNNQTSKIESKYVDLVTHYQAKDDEILYFRGTGEGVSYTLTFLMLFLCVFVLIGVYTCLL